MINNTQVLIDLLRKFTAKNDQEQLDRELFLELASDEVNLTRKSQNHFTSSAFVINQDHSKVLAIFHNIYQSWGWMGGHSDGNPDLLQVAVQEVGEESGITNLKLLEPFTISIENLPVAAHIRRGESVEAHNHLNLTFLFEANDSDEIRIEPGGNSDIKWLPLDNLVSESLEPHMKLIYHKIINRIRNDIG